MQRNTPKSPVRTNGRLRPEAPPKNNPSSARPIIRSVAARRRQRAALRNPLVRLGDVCGRAALRRRRLHVVDAPRRAVVPASTVIYPMACARIRGRVARLQVLGLLSIVPVQLAPAVAVTSGPWHTPLTRTRLGARR